MLISPPGHWSSLKSLLFRILSCELKIKIRRVLPFFLYFFLIRPYMLNLAFNIWWWYSNGQISVWWRNCNNNNVINLIKLHLKPWLWLRSMSMKQIKFKLQKATKIIIFTCHSRAGCFFIIILNHWLIICNFVITLWNHLPAQESICHIL